MGSLLMGVLWRLPGRGGLQVGLEENCINRGIDRRGGFISSVVFFFKALVRQRDLECQSEELDFVSATL